MPQAIGQTFGYGPYYDSPIKRGLGQMRAIGQNLTPQQIEAITQGELMGDYQEKARRENQEEQLGIQRGYLAETEKRTQMMQQQQDREQQAAKAKGGMEMTTLGGVGGFLGGPAIGSALGLTGGAAAGAGAGAIGAGLGGGAVGAGLGGEIAGAGAAAATGAASGAWLGPVGMIIGAGLGFGLSKLKVICTELHSQGILDDDTYQADSEFGRTLPMNVLIGYHVWAIPVVKLMKKSPLFTRLVSILAIPWAKHMVYLMGRSDKGTVLGKALVAVGIPLCGFIGNVIVSRKMKEA